MKSVQIKRYLILASIAMVVVLIGACAPVAAPTQAPPTAAAQPTTGAAPTTAAAATTAPAAATEAPAATTAPAATGGGSITVAFYQEPNSLNGYYSNQTFTLWVSEMINPGPWLYDDKSQPNLELVSEYPTVENGDISKDGLSYTYKIRSGAKWSDGQPVTSKDIEFTWKAIMNDKNTGIISRSGYDQIDSITTPDDSTAVVKFKQFYAPWYTLFVNSGFLPEHILGKEATLDGDAFQRMPIGTGPFMVKEWQGGDHITLVANENYWRGKPKLDQINIKITASRDAGNAALAAGDVDIVADEVEASIPDLDALAPKAKSAAVASQNFEHYFFNLGTKAQGGVEGPVFFKDAAVRQAYIMCIDRDTIASKLLYGKTKVVATLWPNSTVENTDLKPYPFDPKAAGDLLDKAGWAVGDDGIRAKDVNGTKVRLSFNHETTTGNQLRADVQVFATSTLRGCGMEMLPQNYPSGTLFGGWAQNGPLATGKYDTGGYTTAFTPDPDPVDNFQCAGIPTTEHPEGSNWYRLCDKDLDSMTSAEQKETDPAKRTQIFKDMQKIMYDKAYVAPLYNRLNVIGINSRVQGVRQSPTQGDAYWNTYEWTVSQ